MKFYGDYHTHTNYSDGLGCIEDNVLEAERKGLREIAITEHGLRNPSYSKGKYLREKAHIERIQNPHVKVLMGIEADIIDEKGLLDVDAEVLQTADVLIAGFHLFSPPLTFKDWRRFYFPSAMRPFFKNKQEYITRNTDALIGCVERYPLDVLTHPNHRMFADMTAVGECCAEKGTLMEINVKHFRSFEDIIETLAKTKVRFIVDSDAHRPQDVGSFERVEALIKQYGIEDRIVNLGDNKPAFRSQREKE